MRCVIPGPKIKVFAKALHSLAKIGEDLYVDAQDDRVAFRSVNCSRSAFVSYCFYRDFFDSYSRNCDTNCEEEEEEEDESKCRLCMKAVFVVFKSINQLDKNVETCSMNFSESEYKLRIQFKCRFRVTKTYVLPFIEAEALKVNFEIDKLTNKFTAQSKVLTEAVLNFLTNQEEVTMSVKPNKFLMKNFVEDEEQKTVRTELNMQPGEFEEFSIDKEVSVTYCLKELRSMIGFADAVSLPLSACFSTGGEPIVFSLKCPGSFEGALVMATLSEEPVRHEFKRRSHSTPLNQSQQLSEASVPISQNVQPSTFARKRPPHDVVFSPMASHAQSSCSGSPVRLRNPEKSKRNSEAIECDESRNQVPLLARESGANLNQNTVYSETQGVDGALVTSPIHLKNSSVIPLASKNARFIFQRCFDTTFNLSNVPGTDKILAPDSDEDGEGDNLTIKPKRMKR